MKALSIIRGVAVAAVIRVGQSRSNVKNVKRTFRMAFSRARKGLDRTTLLSQNCAVGGVRGREEDDVAIVIAGAGIGGLTAALSLHAAGLNDIEIFEVSPEIKPLGVGINVLPHACRELVELGLEERLAETAISCQRLVYSNAHGQEIWSEPRGKAAGYHWPQFSIHRGELQMILLDAVLERLGQESVHFGDALASVETGDRGATATFRSGKRESAERCLNQQPIDPVYEPSRHLGLRFQRPGEDVAFGGFRDESMV